MNLCLYSEHKVEFFDVDSMNVMWHGNYVKIIESARCSFLDAIGYDYIQMKEDGFIFPIVKMHFKYISPAFFKDILCVKTTLKDCDVFLEFVYELSNAKTKQKIAVASTHQVALATPSMTTQLSMPPKLLEAIKSYKEHK